MRYYNHSNPLIMKLSLLVFLLSMGTFAFANSGDFTYDADKVNNSLSTLDALESMHKSSPDASFDELVQDSRFDGVSISKATISTHANQGDLPVLPAFWWGCILGALGILIVYLITEDSEQTKSALWGCLVAGGVYVLFWIFWVLLLGNAFWFLGG